MTAEITVTSENFENEVEKADIPVLLDFWASWCGPCMMMAPIVAQLAEERAGTLKVGKVNVDEQPELAARFGISAIPTLILFRNGVPAERSVGYCGKEELQEMLP